MNVVPEPLPGGNALAREFLERRESALSLYGGEFRSIEDIQNRAHWLDQTESDRAGREELFAVLSAYNGRLNGHEAVAASLELLKRQETLVVAGGQQSGLFTGPLLVVYKAVTLIAAAREASETLKRPVVPVFWIAGEDHDWDEVNHTYVLSPSGEVARIRMEHAAGGKSPVSLVRLQEEEWSRAADELEKLLQESDFKSEVMELVRSGAAADNLSDAFAMLMGRLFGKHGLVLLDSADPELRKLEQPLFRRLIRENDELEASYHAAAGEIRSGGYELQANVETGGANLFYIHEGARLLLVKKNGRFTDRKETVSFTEEQLLETLELHPERFSNNVLTRPLMQDYVLPVLATVLGQGEIAYWAITRRAFETVGRRLPPILPRMSYTMVEGTTQKHMEKFGLSFQDVVQGLEEKRASWLEGQDERGLARRFEETKAAFAAMYDPLIEEIGRVQAGLVKLGTSNKEKIADQIAFLQNKVMDALAKQSDAGLRQWERIERSLMPLGRPQERVYNVTHYLNRYGLSWVDGLLELPPDYSGIHRVVYM
ncbi:bacillithiol biosynthesis cysteine-adding enzyme BshC [Paenibacillus spiritus]|uniref:Putative cysteine ligase BshC n=1 Tax=Paenibacillus spiritus TaxID=2496557 RepID=A0A5J5GHB2_9BACL|nr:bacillithiol biosynthesis cysteine-adding enzyme BshC [Paenibacillus spiritus]KAA9007609.1 bacillithiol biosynthesis cysteine-adding enzyme BshC [Paenibacillus spiritus]